MERTRRELHFDRSMRVSYRATAATRDMSQICGSERAWLKKTYHPFDMLKKKKNRCSTRKKMTKKHLGHLFAPQNPTFHSFLPDLAHKKLYSVRGVDFLGKVSGAISVFVCQFLQKRAVSRFLFQIRTKPRWNIGFCCASAFLCIFFFKFRKQVCIF